MTTWTYMRTEPQLWTVGFYRPDEKWAPESDHGSQDEAAARVHWLNGGTDSRLQARIDAALLLCDEVADVNGVPHVAAKFRAVLTEDGAR